MTIGRSLIPAFLCLALAFAGRAGDPGLPGIDPLVEGPVLVRLVDDPDVTIESVIDAFNADHPKTPAALADAIPTWRLYLLELDLSQIPPAQVPQVLDALDEEFEESPPPGAGIIELDYQCEAPEGKSGGAWVTGVVDGGDFGNQYPLGVLGLDVAHGLAQGAGVAVAVLDTGVDATHPALQGRVLANGFNFIDGNGDTTDTGNGADDDGDGATDEMTGHGTYVAGLVALAAPGAMIMPVVVLDDEGVGDLWTMVQGIVHAVDHGAEVINMSLSTTYRSDVVEAVIQEASARGAVVVAAAGNFDRDDPRENPAMQDFALGVVATDDLDVKAPFSNYHENKVFISAPGGSPGLEAGDVDPDRAIVSILPGGGYAAWEGTSFSTAFVSAAAALVRSQHPEAPPTFGTYSLVRFKLESTAVNIDGQNPQHAGLLGAGRLDVAAAVATSPAAPQPGDVNADGVVNVEDLIALIQAWGPCPAGAACPADLNADNVVGVDDLVALILNWG